MRDVELEKDKEVIRKATPGPWVSAMIRGMQRALNLEVNLDEDAEFISRARSRWPVAVEELERLKTINVRLRFVSRFTGVIWAILIICMLRALFNW